MVRRSGGADFSASRDLTADSVMNDSLTGASVTSLAFFCHGINALPAVYPDTTPTCAHFCMPCISLNCSWPILVCRPNSGKGRKAAPETMRSSTATTTRKPGSESSVCSRRPRRAQLQRRQRLSQGCLGQQPRSVHWRHQTSHCQLLRQHLHSLSRGGWEEGGGGGGSPTPCLSLKPPSPTSVATFSLQAVPPPPPLPLTKRDLLVLRHVQGAHAHGTSRTGTLGKPHRRSSSPHHASASPRHHRPR